MRTKKALKNITSALFLQFVLILSNLVVPRFIVLTYGSNVNGLVNSIAKFLSYIGLLETGLGGVVKARLYKVLAKKDKKELNRLMTYSQTFFSKICVILILYVIVLCLIYPRFFSNEFNSFFSFSLIIVLSINTFAQYYFGITNQMLLQADQKAYIINVCRAVVTIISTILMVVLMNLGFSIQIVELIGTLIIIIAPIIFFNYVKKEYRIKKEKIGNDSIMLDRWDGMSHSLSSFVHTNTDIFILTILSKFSEISVYSIYSLVTSGLRSILSTFTQSISSTFGNLYANGEKTKLEMQFKIFDYFHLLIITIVFTIAGLFITPFIKLYINNVSDINYIRITFGVIIIISEVLTMLTNSYTNIIYVIGAYKETKMHGWIECLINIFLSIFLVNKFGIVGLAIGTVTATLYRLIVSINYVNKNVLDINISKLTKKYFLNIAVSITYIVININIIDFLLINDFVTWTIYLIVDFMVFSLLIVCINCMFFKQDIELIYKYYIKNGIKIIINNKGVKNESKS